MTNRKVKARSNAMRRKVVAPFGYVEWHEWAAAQARAGHKSRKLECGHWAFDNEIHNCPNGKS